MFHSCMREMVPAKVLALDKWFQETSLLLRDSFTALEFISHGACCDIKGSLVDPPDTPSCTKVIRPKKKGCVALHDVDDDTYNEACDDTDTVEYTTLHPALGRKEAAATGCCEESFKQDTLSRNPILI